VDNNNSNSTELNKESNETDINPTTPPSDGDHLSPLDTEEVESRDDMVIEKEPTDGIDPNANTTTATIKLDVIIVEKPNEVITLSETVTLSSSNNIPDKLNESSDSTIKHVYPIPHIIPQKPEDSKPIEMFSKIPNYAIPPGVPKPTFSVLRTKSGEIIPRYVIDNSKPAEKPNYTISKSRNTPTKGFPPLRTNSSEIVPKPSENTHKNATSPLTKVHTITKSDSLQRTNSNENLSKQDKSTESTSRNTPTKSTPPTSTSRNTPTKSISRDTPTKSTPLHRTKSSENISKMNKPEDGDKTKEAPPKPLQSKSRESSFTTLIRTKSSEKLQSENQHTRKSSDADTQLQKETTKPVAGELEKSKSSESVPAKSPTYIYPKPAHTKSPSKSPNISKSPSSLSPTSSKSPFSKSPTSKSPSKSPKPGDKSLSPSKLAADSVTIQPQIQYS
jgi:hypothetical protein